MSGGTSKMPTLPPLLLWLILLPAVCHGYKKQEIKLPLILIQSRVTNSMEVNKYSLITILGTGKGIFTSVQEMWVTQSFFNFGIYFQTCKEHDSDKLCTGTNSHTRIKTEKEFVNRGTFIFDYSNAKFAPRFDLGSTANLDNEGKMYFEIGGSQRNDYSFEPANTRFANDPDVSLSTSLFVTNSGMIAVTGTSQYKALLAINKLPGALSEILHLTNSGQIYLKHTFWAVNENIEGDGCISLSDGAEITIKNSVAIDEKQVFFFNPSESTSTLNFDVGGPQGGISVSTLGFKKDCIIRFFQFMTKFDYNEEWGLLMFAQEGRDLTHTVQVGPLYKRSDFSYDGYTLKCGKALNIETPKNCRPTESWRDTVKLGWELTTRLAASEAG